MLSSYCVHCHIYQAPDLVVVDQPGCVTLAYFAQWSEIHAPYVVMKVQSLGWSEQFLILLLSTRLVDRSETRNSLVIGTTIQVTTVRGHKCSAFHGTTVTTFYWHQVLNVRPWYVHENYPLYSLFPTHSCGAILTDAPNQSLFGLASTRCDLFCIPNVTAWLGLSWPWIPCRDHSHDLVSKFSKQSSLQGFCHIIADHVSSRTPDQ